MNGACSRQCSRRRDTSSPQLHSRPLGEIPRSRPDRDVRIFLAIGTEHLHGHGSERAVLDAASEQVPIASIARPDAKTFRVTIATGAVPSGSTVTLFVVNP